MIDRLPRRLRLGLSRSKEHAADPRNRADEVAFVAYGEDCILSGRTILDADRLTDMLNAHDEYGLVGVTVERFDGGEPLEVAEIVVPRDEIFLVDASGPRGDAARRHRTMPQHLAVKMGPYRVRGYFHALPGADPVVALRRRKAMVPLTNARIEYTIRGQRRETRVDTVIVNREQIDWVEAVMPTQIEFPEGPKRLVTRPARPAPARG
ncbi:MAG: hypothetical protein Q7S35_06050 [Candidatus Limnocylindrales bacterium]|nr:hypothetical protein [Candidatus Limnocylindrales bacterium]